MQDNKSRAYRGVPPEPGVNRREEPGHSRAWRVMHSATQRDRSQTCRAGKVAKVRLAAELDVSPGPMTEPAANAPLRCPQAPAMQVPDKKTSTRPQHASHFADDLLAIPNEAKHGYRNDIIEGRIVKGQGFCLPLDEPQANAGAVGAPARGGDHDGIHIESRYDRSPPCKLQSERPVAAADIQQSLAGHRAETFEEKLLFESIGDPAKTA